jgi:hypothetical protein
MLASTLGELRLLQSNQVDRHKELASRKHNNPVSACPDRRVADFNPQMMHALPSDECCLPHFNAGKIKQFV